MSPEWESGICKTCHVSVPVVKDSIIASETGERLFFR